MKKPEGCKTPTTDREQYNLTVPDLKFIEKQVMKINAMLSYYVNMPENKTGELATVNTDRLEYLIQQVDDIKTTLENVSWLR